MNTIPLDEHALDFLDPEPRRVIRQALKAVVEHPDIYPNGFYIQRARTGSGFEFYLAYKGLGPFTNNQILPANVMETLEYRRIAGPRVNRQWPESYRSFTEEALDWQRTYGVGPDEIRKEIGHIIRRQASGSQGRYFAFDAETTAETIETTPEQVNEQFEILCGVGLVERRRIGDGKFGVLGLSNPAGMLWAEEGYRPVSSLGTQTINVTVDLHLEIRTIIEEARATDVADELVREFEALLHRAEEELEKPPGKGNYQRMRELVAFAADVKEFVPHVGRLVAEHGDKVQQMIDAAM